MKQMQVTSTEGAPRHFQDDIPGLNKLGPGSFDDLDLVLSLPDKSLHCVGVVSGRFIVGDVLLRDGAAVMANELFDLVCCLGCHICDLSLLFVR